MGPDTVLVRVAENGRMSIPARQRKQLGLEDGGMVVARVENGELRIRPVQAVLAELQAWVRPYVEKSGDTVDKFLADRRREAEREEQK